MRQANAKEDGGSIGLDIHLIKILIVYFVTLLLMVDGCCFLSLGCKKKNKTAGTQNQSFTEKKG